MRTTLAAAVLLAAHSAALANDCETALAKRSQAAGLPTSLAAALASSLAIGPGGTMEPWAVQADGRTSMEGSPSAAARTASFMLARGAGMVRVGCLGVTVHDGMTEAEIMAAIDPDANVAGALGGISSGMVESDIGESLAAISSGAPTVVPPATEPRTAYPDLPAEAAPASPGAVGFRNAGAAPGSVGATWGLFSDSRPKALANP